MLDKSAEKHASARSHRTLQPEGWPRPSGYANGIEARGRMIFVGGQVGWTPEQKFEARDLPGQLRQTLENVLAVLAEAGAGPEHITMMTWYLTDKRDYLARLKDVGRQYKAVMGRVYPPMAVVEVTSLIEDEALVEIQATAVVPD